jgi:hypothetical protein
MLLAVQSTICGAVFQDKGFIQYGEGERASSAEQRTQAFREALHFYTALEKNYPSGRLLYNIGNCYFQLSEYGLALYYYYKAEKLLPRDEKIKHNIQLTMEKLSLHEKSSESFVSSIFKFSLYEQMIILLSFMLITFIFASLYIWLHISAFRFCSIVSCFCSILICINVLWGQYLSEVTGVLIQPTAVYVGPGLEYALANTPPQLSGMKVSVLQTEQHDWLKIRVSSGQEGYVMQKNVRVI